MAKNLPQPARDQSTTMPSIADMSSRSQKPSRTPQPVNADNATLTPESMPRTPAEQAKNPVVNIAPPEVAVTVAFPGMTLEDAKEPTCGPDPDKAQGD